MSIGDNIGTLLGALIVVTYHYGTTRDVRRTLHRIADALESGDHGGVEQPRPAEHDGDDDGQGGDGR